MKKISEWVIDILSILVLATSAIISALDLFGVVDIASLVWTPDKVYSKVLNILVVMVGTIGTTLILERRLLLKTLAKNVEVIRDKANTLDITSNTISELIKDIQTNRLPTNELSLRLAGERQLLEEVLDISKEFAGLKKAPVADFFEEMAYKYVRDCKDKIRHLSSGTINIDPKQNVNDFLSLYRKSEKRLKAISYGEHPEYFWENEVGRKVLDANSDAIKRGVEITRIFILTSDQVKNPRVMAILTQQKDAGIEVLVADSQSIPPDLKEDYGILDESLVFQMDIIFREGKVPVWKGYLTIDEKVVMEKKKSFEGLSLHSKKLKDIKSTLKQE